MFWNDDGSIEPRMPHGPVVGAVAAAAATAATGGTFLGFTGFTAALLAGASSFVLSSISSALQPDPPSLNNSSFQTVRSQGISRQIRQAVTERRIIYGEYRASGPLVLASSTNDNDYLHLVIVLASHEVEEIGEVFINQESVTDDMLDGDGIVNSGRYDGLIRIKKYLGTTSQTADSDLVSEVSEWTTDHRLQGCAYIYARIKWDRDIFPSGIPNFSAWVKGKKLYDTRDSTTRWTNNVALMARDYLIDDLGYQAETTNINEAILDASANTCDEMVNSKNIDDTIESADASTDLITLTGVNNRLQYQTGDKVNLIGGSLPTGLATSTDYYVIVYQRKDTPRIKLATSLANAIAGTAVDITADGTGTVRKIAEPRYHGGGVIKTNGQLGKNLQEILSGMGGQAVHSGGKWKILAGEYQTPTLYFDENDLAGKIKIQTKVTRTDRFNQVQGVYASPINDGNPSDYPNVVNATYVTEDGEDLPKNLDQPFIPRPSAAQRVSKIFMERSRQEIVFSAPFKLTAFGIEVGNNFFLSVDKYGWDEKVFEVIDWSFIVNDEGQILIDIVARENASAVYDWNNGEETLIDPAPNTNLPNPFDVEVVTGFSLDSQLVYTQEQDKTYKVNASWNLHPDAFVQNGGKYEIQWKRADRTVYTSNAFVDGTITSMVIPQLDPDVLYDVRIFAYNSLGVRSDETLIEDFQVGSSIVTNTEDWENNTETRDGDDWESDDLDTEDWDV